MAGSGKTMENITYEILTTQNPLNIEKCFMRAQEFYGHEGDTTLHWHDGTEVALGIEGKLNLIDGKEYLFFRDDIAFVNSRVIHQAYQ